MTEHTKRRLKKGWDIGKSVTLLGSILLLMHQSVDLRGKVLQQNEKQVATASSVASVVRDVSKLSGRVSHHDDRLTRLERGAVGGRGRLVETTPPVAVNAPSQGPVKVLGQVIAAPFKLAGGLWRAFSGGK